MKKLLSALFIIVPVLVIALFQISSCSKSSSAPAVCDVRGVYTGTNLAKGVTSAISYTLENDNFAQGGTGPGTAPVTFGSYTNTCDSVKLMVFYTANSDYYLLKGKLINGNTISGSFNNLTMVSDSGTFTITK
jgi:hypothetical protein